MTASLPTRPEDVRVGIIDVGGARFKAGVWLVGEPPSMVWYGAEDTGDLAASGRTDDLIDHLRSLVARLRQRSDVVIGYGGGRLRDPVWNARLLPVLAELTDEARVLTAHEEGALLLLATHRGGTDLSHLLDIGGSSVQLVSRGVDASANVQSWPYGTHRLEEQFNLKQGSPIELYEDVEARLIADMHIDPVPGAMLAIGTSDAYAPLMPALGARLGVADPRRWTAAEIGVGWRYCARLMPGDFAALLPTNPSFLYGADKGLLVASVVAGKLNSAAITVTDASVMRGVACRHFAEHIAWT